MKFKFSKRFLGLFLATLFIHELVSVRKTESMAIATEAVQLVLHSQTVCALAVAIAFVAKHQIEKYWPQQVTLPEKQPDVISIKNDAPSAAEPLQLNNASNNNAQKKYTFKNFSIKNLLSKEVQKQIGAPLAQEQKALVHSFVTNPLHNGIAPVNTKFIKMTRKPWPFKARDEWSSKRLDLSEKK